MSKLRRMVEKRFQVLLHNLRTKPGSLRFSDVAYRLTIGATIVLCLVGLFLFGILVPPVYKRVEGGKAFDKVPSLFANDKPGADKKS